MSTVSAKARKPRAKAYNYLSNRLEAVSETDLASLAGPDIHAARKLAAGLLTMIETELRKRGPCQHRWGVLVQPFGDFGGFEMCTSDCRAIRRMDHEPPPRRAQHEASRDNVMMRISDHLDMRAAEYEASERTAPPRRAAGSNVIPFPKVGNRRSP